MYPFHALLAATTLFALTTTTAQASELRDDDGDRTIQTLTVGMGALWFAGHDLRPLTNASPTWTVRFGWEATEVLGVELAWIGNSSLERTQGLLQLANLFEYDLKLNLAPNLPLIPFVTAGMGYGAWTGAADNTDLFTWTLPLGAGFEVRADDIVIQARGTYRQVFMDETEFTEFGADHVTLTLEFGNRF